MRYLPLAAILALADCASTPPPREAPRKEVRESQWEAATFGFTLGLLVVGIAWNFMPSEGL